MKKESRLTTDKAISEMGMCELSHNCCYIKENNARYRDYQNDYDARELARKLMRRYTGIELSNNDETFDEEIAGMLCLDAFEQEGLIALFYCNLWAMADLREKLKEYEDLEEKGLLLKLENKYDRITIGEDIYIINEEKRTIKNARISFVKELWNDYDGFRGEYRYSGGYIFEYEEFGKTVFLSESEAEDALKQLQDNDAK